MAGGFFVTLYDLATLKLYLREGIFGSLMKPVIEGTLSSRSIHYSVLADYACSRQGSHIFFFLKRKVFYGGVITGSHAHASFYINGPYSPLGRAAQAEIFWDESERYRTAGLPGLFFRDDELRSQPYILQFEMNELSGKFIDSDDLYFALGQFAYPLPSNTIQEMSFCPLTPGETSIALDLIENSDNCLANDSFEDLYPGENQTFFNPDLLTYNDFQNEAHLEFTLLANLKPLYRILGSGSNILCRQVPLGPYKPYNIDRADICLYNSDNLLRGGTIPNIIIELKKDRANYKAYGQMVRYLTWLKRVLGDGEEFEQIHSYIIAPGFYIRKNNVRERFGLDYEEQIKMYDFRRDEYYSLLE